VEWPGGWNCWWPAGPGRQLRIGFSGKKVATADAGNGPLRPGRQRGGVFPMREAKRVSPVQVPAGVQGQLLGPVPETNLRLVASVDGGGVVCRCVEVHCAVSPPEIRSAICGILRRRDQVIAVPSPFQKKELLVVGA